MTRGGRKLNPNDPERRCIATGDSQPKAGLIRFVIDPEGSVTPDILEKLPGRGMWLSATPEAFALAAKKNPFSRSAKQQVKVPEDLFGNVSQQMTRRVIDLISLARKGGYAICGFSKTKDAVTNEAASVLIQAIDGSERQSSKIRPPDGEDTFIGCLTAQELGLAFGRESVIHAALAEGGLSDKIVVEAKRLAGLRGTDTSESTDSDPQTST